MAKLVERPLVMVADYFGDYGLIDSGNGRKLERFGPYKFIRPEPQAMWSPKREDWAADGEFVPGSDEDGGGRWQFPGEPITGDWAMHWGVTEFRARCTPFRHLGFFPDMSAVWDWMTDELRDREDAQTLNLFGYTGVGTLVLAQHGPVTHVDASKKSVAQARENAEYNGMADFPIRWLVDDASKFVAREVRRGNRYDGIILDPPKFGRGPKNETWRLEDDLPELIANCRKLLDAESSFLFLTVYAIRMSSLALAGLLEEHFADLPGQIEHGELAIREDDLLGGQIEMEGRLLPTAIFARWSNPDRQNRVDRAQRVVLASPEQVFAALTSKDAVAKWLAPPGFRAEIHAFDARPGGAFRMTLHMPAGTGGKTTGGTDEIDGTFVQVEPDSLVEQSIRFVSSQPQFAGTMHMAWSIHPITPDATAVMVEARDVPPGIGREDHIAGLSASLESLEDYCRRQAVEAANDKDLPQ